MSIPFDEINAVAVRQLRSLLPSILPGGKFEGDEFVALNPRRSDKSPGSFRVNSRSGLWSDFATSDAGGDPVSLVAFLDNSSQLEAAKKLADRLGVGGKETFATFATFAGKEAWAPIAPIPSDAPKIDAVIANRFCPPGFSLVRGYRYDNAAGEALGHVARYECSANGQPTAKEFRPIVFAAGPSGRREWRSMGFPTPRPLYGLHRLAKMPDAKVLVVEGEKTCEAAAKVFPDWAVTTSPNGSKAAKRTDWSVLAGRDVVVWPDNDDAGHGYANDVTDALRAVGAKTVRIVALPNELPAGWDLADAAPAGVDLQAILAGARKQSPTGPLPLFPPLPPAERYPVERLGVLSEAAVAIARKIQVPEAMAAQSVLATAALAVQAHADVTLPFGQTRPLSLDCVTVASSGDRKTGSDTEASWPIAKREKVLHEEHRAELASWLVEHAAWSAERRKIEADRKVDLAGRREQLDLLGPEPRKPLSPFLVAGDLTLEGLLKAWPDAHGSLGLFTSEGGVFTGGHSMSEESRLRAAAILSELWDGRSVKRVRAGDGVSILHGRRLSIHILLQPEAAAAFLTNGVLKDQGLLSRLLIAAPQSLAGSRLWKEVSPADDRAIRNYGARLLSILEAPIATADGRNELSPRVLTLDADATKAWCSFYDHVERQISGDLKLIADLAAKSAEHAARLAGVMTMARDLAASEIDLTTMNDGIELMDWYLSEALRLAQAGRTDLKLIRASTLLEWMRAQDDDVAFSDIMRLGPSGSRIKTAAEECVSILLTHGWLVETSVRPRRFRVSSED